MKQLPDIRITIENVEEEILKLLNVVKPTWKKDEIQLKKLSGGFSCLMYCCFNNENGLEGVTVRARTNTFIDFPHVRESNETKVVQALYVKELFPEVLAIFQNGYCYTYIQGQPLHSHTILTVSLDDKKIKLMARKLAEIHSTKVEGLDYTTTPYFRHLYMILDEKYPVDMDIDGVPTREEFRRQIRLVEEHAKKTGSPFVLCHGDAHPGNIVYNSVKEIVTYVDWELTHVGYQAADIAYTLQGIEFLGLNPAVKLDLPEDLTRKYFQYYLEKWHEVQGKNINVTDEDISKMESQVNVFRLGCQLFCILFMLSRTSSAKPDHVDTEEFKLHDVETTRQAHEPSEAKAMSEDDSPTLKFDRDNLKDESRTKDYLKQMFAIMYGTYKAMRDEFLPGNK